MNPHRARVGSRSGSWSWSRSRFRSWSRSWSGSRSWPRSWAGSWSRSWSGLGLALLLMGALSGCAPVTVLTTPPLAPTFSLTVARAATHITLRYPTNVGEWRVVCVTVRGKDDDRQNPGDYIEWLTHSCWKPRFRVEEYRLRPNAYTVQGVLDYDGGQMTTPILTIKPEPIDREPFPNCVGGGQ